MLQKYPLENPFYEKIKIFKKGPFMIESFINVGLFDYETTHVISP
jgi:hypothetical protein